ncbi:MAG: hypothetical protein E7281_06165 [Lachnospiraceae bacterium]|nr:hypothetical protein [Lachnospiraceae bacterium]
MEKVLKKITNVKNKPLIQLVIFVVAMVVMIIISNLVVGIPIVPVCAIAILEAVLAALLNRIPLWIHGLVIIAQIVAGIICGKLVFMALMAVVYALAVVLLFFWSKR